MKTKVRKIGNSAGILLAKSILDQSKINESDNVNLTVEGTKIIIEKVDKKPREGWEEQLAQANALQDTEKFFDDKLESDFEKDEWTW